MPTFATKIETLQYSKRFPDLKYNLLGNTEFHVSPVGFGSYRVHISVDEHRQALKYAINNGINLIDTSSNYADGGSEELIGSVLKEMIHNHHINRDQMVIVSKAGYLQGHNFNISQQLKASGEPYPDLVEYGQGLEHCIHPRFIEYQLSQSLQRLQLTSIDIYLLHNPEYYLLWAEKNAIPIKEAQKEFYRRIEQAFMHLEIEAENGRIQFYGISSNTFPEEEKMYSFVDLSRVWAIAQSISKKHRFRVVQMPLNLIETGVVTKKNQPGKKNVLDFAGQHSLGILINRPLNAYSENQLTRLVSVVTMEEFVQKRLDQKFQDICALEQEFIELILPLLHLDESVQENLAGLFYSGTYLSQNYQKLGPYWQWLDNQAGYLTDHVSYGIQLVNDSPDKTAEVVKWLDKYVENFNDLLGYLTLYYGEKTGKINDHILNSIIKNNRSFGSVNSLQQLALSILFSTRGISSVLIGMRRKEYVDNVLSILKENKPGDVDKSFWANLNDILSSF